MSNHNVKQPSRRAFLGGAAAIGAGAELRIWTSGHIDPSQNKVWIMSERPDSETSQNTTLFFLNPPKRME